jgi:threonine dehydrogenase-like Zn-dependent dehydrogenase
LKAVAIFPAEQAIRVIDQPEPVLTRDSEVRLKILDVGVCGTDREVATFEYGAPPEGSPYLVIGHESLGEVIDTGSAVNRFHAGDLVVTMVRRPCGLPECPACAVGRPDFCVTGKFTERGINGRHGFMAERIVDDQMYMIAVPPNLREIAVLVEPLTIAEKAMIEVGEVQDRLPWLRPGENRTRIAAVNKAVVLGAGPVGLLGAMALLRRGFQTWVYSLEPDDSPKALWVESVGGKYLAAKDVPIDRLAATVGNIDLIYEATGASQIAFKAMEALGVNGVFILTGVPGLKGRIEIDADLIMRNLVLKNQLIYGTVNAGQDAFDAAVADLSEFHLRWPQALTALITGRYAPEACPALLLGPPSGIKRVISFAGHDVDHPVS